MQKFLTDTLTGRYIKALLNNSYLPSYRTVRENDFIISGIRYAYKEFIIEALSTGYIDPTDANIQNIASYKIIELYTFGDKNLKFTHNFVSRTNYYDTETHIQLGDYLRVLRDLKNIDLMPFYNCYCDKYTLSFIISQEGVKDLTREDIKYETVEIPIRYNQTYTIAIDSPSEVTLCPALFTHENLITIDSVNISKFLWNSQNIIKYPSMQFTSPITYNLHNEDVLMQKYEKNLYLFIQVPYGLKSSIVVLEGDYTDTARKVIGIETIQEMTNAQLDYYFLSDLSLLKLNDRERYAFSDRLIEFLYRNTVDIDEEVNGNIERVQNSLYAQRYFPVMKDIWQNELRGLIYNKYMEDADSPYDTTGYVDKDVEKFLGKPPKQEVVKKILISIEADTTNMRTSYGLDDKLNLSGLVITAHYTTGESEDVTSLCSFNPIDGAVLTYIGNRIITVTYKEDRRVRTTTFNISVNYDALKFYSDNPFTLTTTNEAKNWAGNIEFSTDKNSWDEWDGSTISSSYSGSQNTIYLRGMSNTSVTGTGDDPANYGNGFVLTGTAIYADGDIGSLLDYEKIFNDQNDSITMGDRSFEKLFYNNTTLVVAPRHNLSSLSEYCYKSMYEGCTRLRIAPNLRAQTLFTGCYERMFYGCKYLYSAINKSAINLPAISIPAYAYRQMFYGCTTLNGYAPSLSNVRYFSTGCCQEMFYGCTLLKLSDNNRQDPYYIVSKFTFPPVANIEEDALTNMFTCTGGRWQGTPLPGYRYYANTTHECIQLSSSTQFSIRISAYARWNGNLQYSFYPNDSFKSMPYSTITATRTANDGKYRIFLRGTFNSFLNTSVTNQSVFTFVTGTNISCSGNIESLLDWKLLEEGYDFNVSNDCFKNLFCNQTSLVSIPKFNLQTIRSGSYYQMFAGTSVKLSQTSDSTYAYEFRIPAYGTGTAQGTSFTGMFVATAGTWQGTPLVNTTYYTDKPII